MHLRTVEFVVLKCRAIQISHHKSEMTKQNVKIRIRIGDVFLSHWLDASNARTHSDENWRKKKVEEKNHTTNKNQVGPNEYYSQRSNYYVRRSPSLVGIRQSVRIYHQHWSPYDVLCTACSVPYSMKCMYIRIIWIECFANMVTYSWNNNNNFRQSLVCVRIFFLIECLVRSCHYIALPSPPLPPTSSLHICKSSVEKSMERFVIITSYK